MSSHRDYEEDFIIWSYVALVYGVIYLAGGGWALFVFGTFGALAYAGSQKAWNGD